MTYRGPAAVRVLCGLKVSLPPRCPLTGRLQPYLPLALAHGFDLQFRFSRNLALNRHASHTTKPISRPPAARQQYLTAKPIKHDALVEKLNPPISTLPAQLDFPERKPDQSTAGYWWKVGKAFWMFYKQGVKNIYGNSKAAKEIRARIGRTPAEGTSKSSSAASSGHPSLSEDSHKEANTLLALSRSEWHLERRSKSEMRRVPIFAVILALFGEWTPLLVMFATPIVPYNCRIPRQIRRSREKQETRRSRSFRGAFRCLDGPSRGKPYVPSPRNGEGVLAEGKDSQRQPTDALSHVCRTLNLYSAWQDTPRAVSPLIAMLGSSTRASLHRHIIKYLRRDDEFLLRGRGKVSPMAIPSLLRDEEAMIAAEERGINVLRRPLNDVRHDLGLWLDIIEKEISRNSSDHHYSETVVKLCLMRPNQWDEVKRRIS